MENYHLIGIKGAGMSALAQILHDMGHRVQGSDVQTELFTQKPLEQRRIPLLPFDAGNIRVGLKVIASNAFPDEHPEISVCREKQIPMYRYHHFLGEWIRGFTSIAVTGTHGKTTTTGMLAHLFGAARPTSYLIGDGTGLGMPDSRYFVFESCEYRRHFLAYSPDYAVITNIDFDHPDYFSDIDDVTDAFREMAKRVKKRIVACGDDANVQRLAVGKPVLHYGFGERNELRAYGVATGKEGTSFAVDWRGHSLGIFFIPQHGRHNVLNALAAIGVALLEDLNVEQVRACMATFRGVKRRFTEKIVNGNILIDDYAHHPTEIRATLDAVRAKYPDKKVISVFQPHTYSRLEKFMDEFAESLSGSDEVYLCNIFGSARESTGNVSIQQLIERIPSSSLISEQNIGMLRRYKDCVLLFMGAGDIQKYEESYELQFAP